MSLAYDKERCTGQKLTHEGFVLCQQSKSCKRHMDEPRPIYQAWSDGAVRVNETCEKKIEVKP